MASVPALVDDFNPEAVETQLVIADDTLSLVDVLREAGAITPTQLDLSTAGDLSYERYEALGAYLGQINRSCSWWVGDWMLYGEGTYGEKYAQAITVTGLAEQTLLNRIYVCKHVPPSRRRSALSFSVHAEVAPLNAKEQRYWLDRAEKGGWTRAQLREAMKAKRKDEKPTIDLDGSEGLREVAEAILRDAVPHIDSQHHLIPNEDIARLKSALGREEEE